MLPLLTIISQPFAEWHHMTATDNQNPLVFQGSVEAIVVLILLGLLHLNKLT